MFLMKGISSLLLFVSGCRQYQCSDQCFRGRKSASATTPVSQLSSYGSTVMYSGASGEDTVATIEVCVSPGCVADGADEALLKLQALSATSSSEAPPARVVSGVCCSLCGNGPVARENAGGKSKNHRKLNTNQKLLDLLSLGDEADLEPRQRAVLDGIDLCLEGNKALSKKKYPEALEKYALGIERGRDAAMELQVAIGKEVNPNHGDEGAASLQWLVQALCNEATAKLETRDFNGAIASAEQAVEASSSSSVEALEVLQRAYQETKGKDSKELVILESLFALYQAEEEQPRAKRKKVTPMEANRRRTLGFRLAKLQAAA